MSRLSQFHRLRESRRVQVCLPTEAADHRPGFIHGAAAKSHGKYAVAMAVKAEGHQRSCD